MPSFNDETLSAQLSVTIRPADGTDAEETPAPGPNDVTIPFTLTLPATPELLDAIRTARTPGFQRLRL